MQHTIPQSTYTATKQAIQEFPNLMASSVLTQIFKRSLFHLKSSYRITLLLVFRTDALNVKGGKKYQHKQVTNFFHVCFPFASRKMTINYFRYYVKYRLYIGQCRLHLHDMFDLLRKCSCFIRPSSNGIHEKNRTKKGHFL